MQEASDRYEDAVNELDEQAEIEAQIRYVTRTQWDRQGGVCTECGCEIAQDDATLWESGDRKLRKAVHKACHTMLLEKMFDMVARRGRFPGARRIA